MRDVSLYVNNIKLDLFKDEEIQITSSIQNVQDISKVFTDFSQTFTVPCTKTNNEVFEYYYNSDVDASFSAQNRQESRIEINNTIFRVGKLQLESAEVKGLQSDNYKVTFYGEVTTLKDLFANDKLSDLDYDLEVEYDDTTVTNSIDSLSDLDVRFPLISSNRVWEYGDASPADISTLAGKIDYTELFPAVKDSVILESMEAKYGITFTGLFLTDQRFTNAFTYWKNRKTPNFTNSPEQVLFNVGGSAPMADGIFTLQYIDPTTYAASGFTYAYTRKVVNFWLTPDIDCTFSIDIYNNGQYQSSIEDIVGTAGVQSNNIQLIGGGAATNGSTYADREYTWYIRSNDAVEFEGSIQLNIVGTYVNGGTTTNVDISSTNYDIETLTTSNDIDFKNSAPNITVAEWFKGKLNQFNLTCFPTTNDLTFQLEPLDRWYKYGVDYDITKYVDIASIQYERIKLYKTISFEHQDCKSFMNVAFKDNFNRPYGDLMENFAYDGGEFKIKLPFENLLFNKFTDTNLQVGYSMTDPIENADKSYIPKCTTLYLDKALYPADFYCGTATYTSYVPFGQDATIGGGIDYSLNFGSEQSTLKDNIIENSLFLTYYHPYLNSLFNPKSRRVKVKGWFPLDLLTDITLNSKLIIRDKKYLIESIKTNLTTGEVELTLLNDFIIYNGDLITGTIPSTGGTVVVSAIVNLNNQGTALNTVEIGAPAESQFVTTSPTLPTSVTTSTNFEITIPSNGTGSERTNTIPFVYTSIDGTVQFTEYVTITQEAATTYLTGGGAQLLTNTYKDLIE